MDRTGPRVYVPVSLPDSAVPTYAVLEFLGFASPVVAQPGSPAVLCLPASSAGCGAPHTTVVRRADNSVDHVVAGAVNTRSNPSFFPSHPLPVPPNYPITHHIGTDTLSRAPHGLHMVWPTAAPEVVQTVSPPLSPTAVSKCGSTSNACRDSNEKKSLIKVSQVRKPSACGVMASSPIALQGKSVVGSSESSGGVPPRISVSQSEKETIVHTHSSNFRDVVRQLTGASSGDQDLLPVTLPARMANRSNNEGTGKHETNQKCEAAVPTRSVADLGLRKAPLKLHERRKTMRNLEKLSTAIKEIPPLVPSPVTPLASDFEKFCTATTPTGTQGSACVSPGYAVEEDCVILEERGHALAEKSYYVRSPRPGPTLLNLFPESPVCSPRD